MRLITKLSTLCTLALLISCKAENPLTHEPPRQAAEHLYTAAKHAETTMGLTNDPDGHFYASCIRSNDTGPRCSKILSTMVKYLQTNNNYKTITATHLADQTMWQPVSEYYSAMVFTTFN